MIDMELPKVIYVSKYVYGNAMIREVRVEEEEDGDLYPWFFYGNTFLEVDYKFEFFDKRYKDLEHLLNELNIKHKLIIDDGIKRKYRLYNDGCDKLDAYFRLVASFKDLGNLSHW